MSDERDQPKSVMERLEEYAMGVLYSFIERPAGSWRFWVKITVTMFFVTAGPAIAIFLYSLARDRGIVN